MAIQLIAIGRRPPSVIFEESIFGPLHTLQNPNVFAHTNFGENILIRGKTELEKRSLAAEFIRILGRRFHSFGDRRSRVSSCIISVKLDNRRPSYGNSNN